MHGSILGRDKIFLSSLTCLNRLLQLPIRHSVRADGTFPGCEVIGE
jgi:hypothetical protein